MTDFADVAARYIDTWNDTGSASRLQRVESLFADDASYVDPLAAVAGHAGINDAIGAVQTQFPGFVFSLLGPVDGHHDQVRFTWGLGPAGQESPIDGFDVAVLNTDGRIASVHGFLDKVPAG